MKIFGWTLALVFLLGFLQKDRFASDIQLDSRLLQEPLQRQETLERRSLNFADRQYYVDRKYRYELYGMVVSFREHDGDQMLHKSWGDHLNVADICVIWSDSAQSPYLNQLDFWNGQFTCNVKTGSQEAWQSFNMRQLSNNHLITADPYLRSKIADVAIGDQIVVKGWLSEYGHEQGKIRGTSISREDTGNGACETIYVEQFDVLRSSQNIWRTVFYGSGLLLLLMALWYFFSPYKPRKTETNPT